MIDFFKDSATAWLERIRSPIIGSIVVVFVLINWKPLWFLAFSNVPVGEKFEFFDQNTTAFTLYVLPSIIGLGYAIGTPWLKLLGAWVAARPTRRLRSLQDREAFVRRIALLDARISEQGKERELQEAQAATEKAKDQRLIERDRRIEVAKEIEGGLAAEEIRKAQQEEPVELSSAEKAAILVLSNFDAPLAIKQDFHFKADIYDVLGHRQYHRALIEIREAIYLLEAKGLAKIAHTRAQGDSATLTISGFEFADRLKGLP